MKIDTLFVQGFNARGWAAEITEKMAAVDALADQGCYACQYQHCWLCMALTELQCKIAAVREFTKGTK
jgi:hypothetical protein